MPWQIALLLKILACRGVVEKIQPHLHIFPHLFLVYSMSITGSAPLFSQCTIPVLHIFPKFYYVVFFCVLITLFQVVQGVFCSIQISPQLWCVPTQLGFVGRVSEYVSSLWPVE